MKSSLFVLSFLSLLIIKTHAIAPLQPGSYSGAWMGTVGGARTGGSVSISISTNREVVLFYSITDPITGTQIPKLLPAGRLLERRFVRSSHRFSGVSQDHGRSIRGWYRRGDSGSVVLFYADYVSTAAPQ
jgi:hypothetical protein